MNRAQVLIAFEYKQPLKDVLNKALDGFGTANFEVSFCSKTDEHIDILLNATPRKDKDGFVIGVIGVGQDITGSKQVNMESRMTHQLQVFIDTANAPIFGVGLDGLINEWNNKAVLLSGYSRDEIMGKDISQVRQAGFREGCAYDCKITTTFPDSSI